MRQQLATAARHAWAVSPLGQGIESYDGLPAEILYDEPHRQLRRYCPETRVPAGRPVLLVPPLAVSTRCYDLRPGQSLAAHLVGSGRATYVIDYGAITFADREMGFEDWIDDILATAIMTANAASGGHGVDVVGWSLGGTMSLLTAASHPRLPIASLTAFGTPFDYTLIPAVQPLLTIDRLLGTRRAMTLTGAMGGVPRHLVRASYRAMAPRRELTKALHLARNILDVEALARTEAIDDFIGSMPGYPGRAYHQLHSRLMARNELAEGTVRLTQDREVRLRDITTRVLLVGSATDNIANGPAVEAGTQVIPGARYVAADGLSHLGLVAGPKAPMLSWPSLDVFLGQ
ncbi:alpha/beta hydrolase [Nocardioides humilatus]|uniref:Alpha/beta hydrolase n=1 Tax=Nocardioides humilatus TaxID=2607660 RepID=A0A5B1LMN0_9ACTN|nr:alpha/beta hydrolase [Nocardioides humilatus]KAA1420869.1 alpha/beta hydrolase [Nocardioides humilatus]